MTVIDIEKALKGITPWATFCQKYEKEKKRYLSRDDGVLTSADFNVEFSLGETIIEMKDLHTLCLAAIEGLIDETDVRFIANAILLSAFDFIDENTEDACHLLSNSEVMDEVKEAASIINGLILIEAVDKCSVTAHHKNQ